MKQILGLDFDGVIHSYVSGWQGENVIPDPPVSGAIEALLSYMEHFTVCIYSSRFKTISATEVVRLWLIKHGVPETLLSIREYASLGTSPTSINLCMFKPPAFLTIDDRAVTFDGTFPAAEVIKAFKPWYKLKPADVD
jgi:hypothetical protein